ncbi:hypothetical protein Pla175_35450 [Pirellulimonas nuda]|uniref:Uncharacterized protein n=1 Tax=Pirellulimonas nuda TaxID=2528009 RepID=A0A518DF85_9BACT|nr:hypothetical protein Pla175_35450 [Pirellulimonas nuda]
MAIATKGVKSTIASESSSLLFIISEFFDLQTMKF